MAKLKNIIAKVAKSTIKNTVAPRSAGIHSKSLLGRILKVKTHEGEEPLFRSFTKNAISKKASQSTRRKFSSKFYDPSTGSKLSRDGSKVASPEMSAISVQLHDILSKVTAICSVAEAQSKLLDMQLAEQEHATKELAISDALKNLRKPAHANDNELTASLLDLTRKFKKNMDAANDNDGSEKSHGGILGFLARMFGGRKGKIKEPKLNKNIKKVETKSGVRYRDAKTGRFVKESEAVKKTGIVGRAASKIAKSRAGVKVGSILGKSVGAIGKITPELFKKLAIPLAEKAIGKTILKSIPLVGAVAGIGFAVGRLLEGDPVGAGLDAVSGLAGPLTAIPALIASLARDLYSEVFGVQPEEDPQVGSRLSMVTAGVKMAVGNLIRPNIKPQQTASGARNKALQVPKPIIPSNNNSQKKTNAPAYPTVKPGLPSGGKSHSDSKPAMHSSEATKSPVAIKTSDSQHSDIVKKNPVAVPMQVSNNMGTELSKASIDNDNLSVPCPASVSAAADLLRPAQNPTTSPDALGIGNVPDPTYSDIEMYADKMYFGAAA